MKDADPKVIGTRIVNKFLVTPHTRFGNPRAEKAPNYVTYPDACTWLGALWFSKAVKNKDMQQRLKERFEPLFTTEQNMLPRMVHVDYNVVGAVPLERQGYVWPFIHNAVYRNRKPSSVLPICHIIQCLKQITVNHADQIIHAGVCIRNTAKQCYFFLPNTV